MAETQTQNQNPTAAPAARKLVAIEVLRPIMIERKLQNKFLTGTVVNPSADPKNPTIVEVTEEEAAMFCDKNFDGHHSFPGERVGDSSKHDYRRARRVNKAA